MLPGVLKVNPESINEIAQIGRDKTRQSVALTKLADEPWRMAVNEVVSPREAAAVGNFIPIEDAELQIAAIKVISGMKPSNETETALLVRRVRQSDLVASEQGRQGDWLGDLETPDSTVAEEIRIVSRAIKTLAQDEKD